MYHNVSPFPPPFVISGVSHFFSHFSCLYYYFDASNCTLYTRNCVSAGNFPEEMNLKNPNLYLETLVGYVKEETLLWDDSDASYGNSEMEQVSWNSVTRKINAKCNTDIITEKIVKSTWKGLLEAYDECKEYKTATIFQLFYVLSFTDKEPHSVFWNTLDGLFSRKHGKYLGIIQIVMNILFVVSQIYLADGSLDTMANKLCVSELILPFVTVYGAIIILFMCHLNSGIHEPEEASWPMYGITILGTISTGLSLFLSSNGCKSELNNEYFKFAHFLLFISIVMSQILTILIHRRKLDRPPTTNEMSTILVTMLVLALSFTFPLLTSHWTDFYLVTSACMFTNLAILLIYYVICCQNTKMLYKFSERSRLTAVCGITNPYDIIIKREDY